MGYIKVDVKKSLKNNAGVSTGKKDRITIIDLDEVAAGMQRDSKGVRIAQNIQMAMDKYMIQVYGTVSSITPGYSMDGEADARGFMHTLTFKHPGDEEEIMEFIQNHANKNLAVGVELCDSSMKKIYGSPCAPLQLKVTGKDDGTENVQEITFEAISKSRFVPAIYSGNWVLAEPLAVIAADDDTPSVATGQGEYQLTDNTAANEITTLDGAVDGGVYTLIGSGGAFPSTITAAGGDFLLKDGTTWNATANAKLTVKAFKDGAATYKFIEISRS